MQDTGRTPQQAAHWFDHRQFHSYGLGNQDGLVGIYRVGLAKMHPTRRERRHPDRVDRSGMRRPTPHNRRHTRICFTDHTPSTPGSNRACLSMQESSASHSRCHVSIALRISTFVLGISILWTSNHQIAGVEASSHGCKSIIMKFSCTVASGNLIFQLKAS